MLPRRFRPRIAALALAAQAMASIVPAGFVICSHDNGRTMIEPASSLCCDGTEGFGAGRGDPETAPPAGGSAFHSGGDPCKDVPISPAVSALRTGKVQNQRFCASIGHRAGAGVLPALPLPSGAPPASPAAPLPGVAPRVRAPILRC